MGYVSLPVATALLSLGLTAYAQVANTCPENDICYGLNIPETTANSGTGDIFFQISASTSYQWVALGQGSNGMSGANIFVMYASADGNNVTVSPRLGTGNVQPRHNSDAQISLLGGSGVSNGMMTANVRCSTCNTWSGGSMDFTEASTGWIHAYKSGSALNSDDVSESIQQHDDADGFDWDLTQAKGGSDANPFVAAAAGTNPSASASGAAPSTASGMPTSRPSSPSMGQGSEDSGSASSNRSGYNALAQSKQNSILLAHAVCACLAFVALFPIGGILIRVAHFPGLLWTHVALQLLAYTIYIVAVGLGLYMAVTGGYITAAHAIIGLVLFGIIFFQPLLGWMHHRLFKKYGGRTLWSYAHLTVGRMGILLGMVNGGLGLQLAGADRSSYIAYGVCAGVVGLVYMVAIAFGEVKRQRVQPGDHREKDTSGARGRGSAGDSERAMRSSDRY